MNSRGRRQRRRRARIFAWSFLGLGLIAFTVVERPTPRIVYNGSASAPTGFYRVLPAAPLRRGNLVLVRTPPAVRDLAAARGYLPTTVPLIKQVAALSGDTVCAAGDAISINGRHVADRRAADYAGRPLPAWSGCRTLGDGEVFLLMLDAPNAFDSRYFGAVPVTAIIGRLVRL